MKIFFLYIFNCELCLWTCIQKPDASTRDAYNKTRILIVQFASSDPAIPSSELFLVYQLLGVITWWLLPKCCYNIIYFITGFVYFIMPVLGLVN